MGRGRRAASCGQGRPALNDVDPPSPARVRIRSLMRKSFRFVRGVEPTEQELADLVAAEEAERQDRAFRPAVPVPEPVPRATAMRPALTWLSEEDLREAEAVRQLAQSRHIPDLVAALTWYLQYRSPVVTAPRLAACVEEFIVRKRCEGLTARSLYAYYQKLGGFAQEFGHRQPVEITPKEMADYLARWPNLTTRRCRWQVLATFFRWLVGMRYALENPVMLGARAPRVPAPERWVLSPPEAREILRRAKTTDTIGFWVLSLFAGLRSSEIAAIQKLPNPWSVVRFGPGVIELPAALSKTGVRLIPLLSVLRTWLRWLKARRVPFMPPNVWNKTQATRRAAMAGRAPEPPHDRRSKKDIRIYNLGRRTYISCRLSLPEASYAAVSEQVGNSEEIIRKHYRRRVSRRDALQYFSLTPDRV